MGKLTFVVHHGEQFLDERHTNYVNGKINTLDFDEDFWSFFGIQAKVKEKLKYENVVKMLYSVRDFQKHKLITKPERTS
jgi:hypothetical protein